jgi:hypothetical protein
MLLPGGIVVIFEVKLSFANGAVVKVPPPLNNAA